MVAERALPIDPAYLDIDEIAAEKARRHLRDFVTQAWHVVEPATPYQHNWHIDALCDHLEATVLWSPATHQAPPIRNLLVTMPPRAMKSLTISVFFPAWTWIHKPELRFLYASYAQTLSTEHSQLCRMVIESEWYQDRWGDRFRLADDDNLKTRFSNDHRGYRVATSVGASVTGFGGDFVICDDPHNVQQAESEAVRQSAVDWWNRAMSTRLNNPKTGVRIVVMQRVHESDVAGSVLAKGGYTHLNLPMEYEGDDEPTPIGWSDPRDVPGDLLWPERYDAAKIAQFKTDLGSYGYASQFQQRPTPREGGILKRHWFGTYTNRPHDAVIIQSWDTAFKTGTTNDYSVCATIAYTRAGRYLLDVYRERLEFPDLERMVPRLWGQWRPHAVLIEDKASGQSLIQSLNRENRARREPLDIIPISVPSERDWKIKRVNERAPMIEAGRVHLPEAATWLDETIHELTAFPLAAHDDIVDAVMQGLSWIEQRVADGQGIQVGSWLPDDDDDEPRRAW